MFDQVGPWVLRLVGLLLLARGAFLDRQIRASIALAAQLAPGGHSLRQAQLWPAADRDLAHAAVEW